tara:strand:- start:374 stop:898 length:525 start_codon:yes stop_codon:yes gene_type:complete
MGFSKGFNVQLATLFGIGKIPGGGTWASLVVLLIALYEQNAETASFLAFFTLIIGPNAYRKLTVLVDSEDPKEYVLDEVVGMGIAISGVYIFTKLFDQFSFNFIEPLSSTDELFIFTFVVFRFFDISKIGPVGWVENNTNEKAYNRVIGDDIMAALMSIIIVIIFLSVNLWILQ